MPDLLFVYGTLKEGFFNHAINEGRRVPGDFETVEAFPLYLVGARCVPWMVDAPGEGQPVVGQLFEVDAAAIAKMDVLERVDEPGWYRRATIDVRPLSDPAAAPRRCQVYLGAASRLQTDPARAGPLREYTAEHAQMYLRSGADPSLPFGAGFQAPG